MFSECPRLLDAPRLFLLCDGGNAEVLREEYAHVANVRLFFPPLPFEWGCHHAKFTVAVFARACVVSIHTANCGTSRRGSDVTQGLWTQAFPRKQDDAPGLSDFEDQLVAYLTCTHWLGGTLPCGEAVTAASLRAFDFSGARAALVASVPGRHINGALRAYGHMRVRALLEAERFDASLIGSDIVLQFAAVAKVTPQWLQEVFDSFGAGAADDAAATLLGAPPLTEAPGQPRAHIVWPTMREIQCSAGGWGTGGVLPATAAYLAVEALRCRLARWSGAPGAPGAEGRARYPPHMKSFWRVEPATGALAYALLASHNGSRAAWGALEKDGSQLFIKSYELGVLLLPRLAGVRRLVTTAAARAGRSADGATLALRAPFPLPPVRYAAGETPWCMDATPLGEPDAHGVFVCNAMGHDGKPTRALAQGRPARAAADDNDGPIVLD
jgi:tyrosyl-DNA phosphodiesterase-1